MANIVIDCPVLMYRFHTPSELKHTEAIPLPWNFRHSTFLRKEQFHPPTLRFSGPLLSFFFFFFVPVGPVPIRLANGALVLRVSCLKFVFVFLFFVFACNGSMTIRSGTGVMP